MNATCGIAWLIATLAIDYFLTYLVVDADRKTSDIPVIYRLAIAFVCFLPVVAFCLAAIFW